MDNAAARVNAGAVKVDAAGSIVTVDRNIAAGGYRKTADIIPLVPPRGPTRWSCGITRITTLI